MDQQMTSAIYAVIIAFAVNIILSPIIIRFLARLKFGQFVRSDGPQTHLKKSGTPTMGGLIILSGFVASSLFFLRNNPDGMVVVFVTVGFAVIGFCDDYIKVVKKRSLGLRAYQKMGAQIAVTTVLIIYLQRSGIGYEVLIPFTEGMSINLGVFYIPFVFFIMLGTVNGANFTDGLDGLASGVTLLISIFLMLSAWAMGNGLVPVAGAAAGGLLSFLLFNSYPARVIMGDTGSLALGGFVAASSIILKMPLFLGIVAIIYVAEVLSVIIQVGSFKMTGKRVFKMAPIHHHFELMGYSETKIVALFYIITAIMCLVGFLGARYLF